MATGVVAQQCRRDSLFALGRDRRVVIRTVLRADLDVEQPQEMIDLGERGDRALASAPAGALLDRHRRRNAEDSVDVRARGGLHELARIGIERLEIAALSFREQDIERQRALPMPERR